MAEKFNLFVKSDVHYNLSMGYNSDDIDNYTRENLPMYNTDIKLYKGVPNTIQFSIRNQDRKAVSFTGTLQLVILNTKLEQLFTKTLTAVSTTRGLYSASFTELEMRNLEATHYIGHVEVLDELLEPSDVLYSSEKWNPYINIEVIKNDMDLYEESITETTFVQNQSYIDSTDNNTYVEYVSSKVASDITPYHVLSITYDAAFLGTIYVQATTEEIPGEYDWTNIDTITVSGEHSQATVGSTKQYNCLWIRVKYKKESTNTGKVEKFLYHN